MDNFLIPLFSILFSITLYPLLMIYIILATDIGVFAWLMLVAMLSPVVGLWFYVVRKRTLNYLSLLFDAEPHVWNISKTLAEYEELLRKDGENSR
jgi:hypothetical protein